MSGFGNTTDLLAASVSLSVCGLTGILQLPPPALQGAAYAVLSGKGELGAGRDGRHLLSLAEEKQLREVKSLPQVTQAVTARFESRSFPLQSPCFESLQCPHLARAL